MNRTQRIAALEARRELIELIERINKQLTRRPPRSCCTEAAEGSHRGRFSMSLGCLRARPRRQRGWARTPHRPPRPQHGESRVTPKRGGSAVTTETVEPPEYDPETQAEESTEAESSEESTEAA